MELYNSSKYTRYLIHLFHDEPLAGVVRRHWQCGRSNADRRHHGLSYRIAVETHYIHCLERTLFILDWISDPALRRRSNAGLNKGEARNALDRALFFHRHGEIRDRTFENQRYRASGLNLTIAAITLWNTVYLSRAVAELRVQGEVLPDTLLAHIGPLGWEHISFNGDYVWPSEPFKDGFRPLRNPRSAFLDTA